MDLNKMYSFKKYHGYLLSVYLEDSNLMKVLCTSLLLFILLTYFSALYLSPSCFTPFSPFSQKSQTQKQSTYCEKDFLNHRDDVILGLFFLPLTHKKLDMSEILKNWFLNVMKRVSFSPEQNNP